MSNKLTTETYTVLPKTPGGVPGIKYKDYEFYGPEKTVVDAIALQHLYSGDPVNSFVLVRTSKGYYINEGVYLDDTCGYGLRDIVLDDCMFNPSEEEVNAFKLLISEAE